MREAVALFSYLGCRDPSDLENLDKQARFLMFVPIFSSPVMGEITQSGSDSQTFLRHISPGDCYIGDRNSLAKLFDFVDFKSHGNRFLTMCGARREPSPREVGYRFVQQPYKSLDMLAGYAR